MIASRYSYRDPSERRHQHQVGLIQIANELAGRGLCDVLLPVPAGVRDHLVWFRDRLSQAAALVGEQHLQLDQRDVVLRLDRVCVAIGLQSPVDCRTLVPCAEMSVRIWPSRLAFFEVYQCPGIQKEYLLLSLLS